MAGIVRSNPKNYGGACNLGSLFLINFVEYPFTPQAHINYEALKQAIHNAVRMLDEVIDANTFPAKQYENYQTNFRTIGLGITSLADMLIMLGYKYDTEKGRKFINDLMCFISATAFNASALLAKEKGAFPKWDKEKFLQGGYMCRMKNKSKEWNEAFSNIEKYGLRNAKIMSIAPTGTLSLTFGNNCSSGIEPIFSLEYERKVKFGGQDENNTKTIQIRDFAYALWKNCGSPKEYEDLFVTAMNMKVEDHVLMLSEIAKYVDMSVSKTVNIPTDYPYEDTKEVYRMAHDLGIKGITIFRPNDLRPGILIDKNKNKGNNTPAPPSLKRGEIKKISEDVVGKKRRLVTGCGSLHCSAFFDKLTGELLEVFLDKGSQGGCDLFMNGLSRMISLAARAGCSVYDIVDQLESCGTCPSYAVRRATKHDTSPGSCCPTAVGKALLDMATEMKEELGLETDLKTIEVSVKVEEPSPAKVEEPKTKYVCPECGEPLVFEGGCQTCKNCGWSKCG